MYTLITTIIFFILLFLHYIRMEHTRQNNDIKAIKEAKKLFNDVRSNLSSEEIIRIRKEIFKKRSCV